MRIVSWNIELGRNVEQAAADINSSDQLREPDILLVQEMGPDPVKKLAELLDLDYRFAAPADHPKTRAPFGNAVLSRWPMSDTIQTSMPHTAVIMGQKRAATSAIVDVDGQRVVAHSVHLETVLLAIRRRVTQVQSVAEAERDGSLPSVIGGDFNAASVRSLRHFDRPLESSGFERITSVSMKTFRRFGRTFALDHLYVRDLRARSVGVEHRATASDHQPVWCDLELGRPALSHKAG